MEAVMMHISNLTRTGEGCIRFSYMKKAVRKGGGVSYPEFQILQLRRYLRYICTFLMVWGTFHLPLINQYKTQTSCSSKKREKYLQNISLREMASILFRLFCLVEWAQLSYVRIKTNLQRKKRIKN